MLTLISFCDFICIVRHLETYKSINFFKNLSGLRFQKDLRFPSHKNIIILKHKKDMAIDLCRMITRLLLFEIIVSLNMPQYNFFIRLTTYSLAEIHGAKPVLGVKAELVQLKGTI